MIARIGARIVRSESRTGARIARSDSRIDAMIGVKIDAIANNGRNKCGKTNGIFAKITVGHNTGIRGAAPAQGMTCVRADAFPENTEIVDMWSMIGAAIA